MIEQGVGRTAIGVAYVRARESRRPDRLFDDPYAQAFVDESPDFSPSPSGGPGDTPGARLAWSVAIRTRFYDEYLLAATRSGIRQVVLLGAGLDARAFRLAWPAGTDLYEVDLPDVVAFKERVLAARGARPAARRTVVAADLRDDWTGPLAARGFDPAAVTAWLVEGLLIYLSADEAAQLLTSVGAHSAAGSRIAFEHRHDPGRFGPPRAHTVPSMRQYTALWKGGLGADAPSWLDSHGWRVTLHHGPSVTYRPPPVEGAEVGYLTAVKQPAADRTGPGTAPTTTT